MKRLFESLKIFTLKSKRVWMVMRKPTRKEFELISKISAAGVLILGVFGFIIAIIISYMF
jgi:protein transport protein SEC61 subunit gamma-like protein